MYKKNAVLNRLLKFPRSQERTVGRNYILGRVARENVETDSIEDNLQPSDDDLDSIYIDRHRPIQYQHDNQSIAAVSTSSEE